MSKCYHFDKAPQGGKTDKSADSNVLMPCIPGTDSTPVYQGEMEWKKPLKLELPYDSAVPLLGIHPEKNPN